MRLVRDVLILLLVSTAPAAPALAQDPPPRIPRVVLDIRGSVPFFPKTPALADSRGMETAELPGPGLGAQAGIHFYLLKWKAITFGIGGEVAANRSTSTPPEESATPLRPAEEKFLTAAPQISFNFGNGHGWSFLSGGIGVSQWSLIPEGQNPFPSDTEQLKTINYGGGGRWFAKPHIAFTFDIRFYAINPGPPYLGHPGSPRTTMRILSAGVSFK